MISKLKANLPKYKRMIKEKISSWVDFLIYKLKLRSSNKGLPNSAKKRIVFLTENPRIDIIRLYAALKEKVDYEFILLIPHSKLDELYESAGFYKVIYFRNLWDFRIKVEFLKRIDLVHAFIRNCYAAEIILKEFSLPLIVSAKDTSVSSHGLNPPHWYLKKELPSEKFVLENADAILAESLEVCNAYRLFESSKKPKRIYFPNYCESKKSIEIHATKKLSEIHLVYAGSIMGSQANSDEYGNIQMEWLIETLNNQKVHFHIYPNPGLNKVTYNEYYSFEKKYEYFHMHEPLKPENLIKEVSKYHYGIIPFFNEDTKRSREKRYYSTSLKIFNFIEAGLPILISNDMGHQRWIMERYGMAIGVEKSELFSLNRKLQETKYDQLLENIKLHRKKISLESQIFRCIEIYNLLV